MSRWTSYLHRGVSQGGDLLTSFLSAYDMVMSSLWHGQSRIPTEVHRSGLSASRWASVCLDNRRCLCRRLWQVDDGRVPIVPTRTARGEVITTVAVVPSARGVQEAVVVAVLQGSGLSEQLSGIASRRSGAASLSAQRRWWQRMRFQPRPRSRIA